MNGSTLRTLLTASLSLLLVGGLVAVALARGSDGGAPTASPSPRATSTEVAGTPTPAPSATSEGTQTFAVLDVGTVTLSSGEVLRVVDVQPSQPGWRVETQTIGREAEVSFRAGDQRVDWNAELEDGQVRIRVRDRRAEGRALDSSSSRGIGTSSGRV